MKLNIQYFQLISFQFNCFVLNEYLDNKRKLNNNIIKEKKRHIKCTLMLIFFFSIRVFIVISINVPKTVFIMKHFRNLKTENVRNNE